MSRHPADHQSASSTGQLRRFTAIERQQTEAGSHPAAKAVVARPTQRDPNAKARAYILIEKGRTA